jgi:hypothetical protein
MWPLRNPQKMREMTDLMFAEFDNQGVTNQLGACGGARAAAPWSVSVVRSGAAAAWLLLAAPCIALECPTPQPAGTPSAIEETPAQIRELSQLLASGDLGNRFPVLVHDLRGRHPDVPASELVNYLVTAYCPVVNSLTGLGDAEKQARLDAFASQVSQLVY